MSRELGSHTTLRILLGHHRTRSVDPEPEARALVALGYPNKSGNDDLCRLDR